ncbi:uncharacterized protein I303_105053 [Kwoniella dejecticola CBS 10117]|uniref:Transcription elongation factor Eaf N-terminal domain-containing protein n=1 Tax=Kwoniella dejecticola CBS 10117 TaxID=1296121 RepID=A0A1A6A3K6_9TREE|nr:uncharacterized protein I303_05501 [Kwoniella dejecticola CBS 10117]OBR84642.1 hypothetical protein I303_05501 [Kwoniella dejecticola CBS 10117]
MTTEIAEGTYPVQFASSITAQWGGKKRRRDEEDLIGFRYNFKPASITPHTPGNYNPSSGIGGNGQLLFDTNTGIQQVFDVREESSKARECVLVFDEETKSFKLHALPSTLYLTLNRSSKSKAPSIASTSSGSSRSIPLSKAQNDTDAHSEHEGHLNEAEEVEEETPKPKRSRPSDIVPRQTKGGKGLPRKQPLASAPIPSFGTSPSTKKSTSTSIKGKGKGKAKVAASSMTAVKKKGAGATGGGKKKGSAAQEHEMQNQTPTKYKSSEFIEDSDEEIANSEANQEEGFDEFANLLGQSLAEGDDEEEEEQSEEEDDEDEDEDEDDEGLGGARLVVGGNAPVVDDDGSEWI